MLRCPSKKCRQAMKFRIYKTKERIYVDGDEVTIKDSKENVLLEGEEAKKYIKSLYGKQLKVYCYECHKGQLIEMCIEAHKDPMKFFDTDNLCKCGGEVWNDFAVEKNKSEKEQEQEWEGSQRKISMKVTNTLRCEKCGQTFSKGKSKI